MQIKSLEIQGFKSFPDKVKLTFDQGITAVVGPNGSGKSNIVRRRALGVRRTVHQDPPGQPSMEDVIFGGTARAQTPGQCHGQSGAGQLGPSAAGGQR